MWIIVQRYGNRDVVYYGPYETEKRAREYLTAVERDKPSTRNHVHPLVTNRYRDYEE